MTPEERERQRWTGVSSEDVVRLEQEDRELDEATERCSCGHMHGDHTWADGECSECHCRGFKVAA